MILTIMETLKKIWTNIAPYVAGISIGGIVSCVFYGLFRFGFNKALNKIDTTKMENKCITAATNEVKKTTFKVSIQPIVESEITKAVENITKNVNDNLISATNTNNEVLKNLANSIICLGAYFDDSIGVADSKKEAFKESVALLQASIENKEAQTTNEAVVEQLQVLPNIETKTKTKDTTIIR